MHHRGRDYPLRGILDQVENHRSGDAEAYDPEPMNAEVIHQPEVVIRVGIPGAVDLQRAAGLAGISVAPVGGDAPEVVFVPFHRVEGRL